MLKRIAIVFTVLLSTIGMSACCRCDEHSDGSSMALTREELESSLGDMYRGRGFVEIACRGGLPRTSEVSQVCIGVSSSPTPPRKLHVNYRAGVSPPYLVDMDPLPE